MQESICYQRPPVGGVGIRYFKKRGGAMQVLYLCCCGVDIHKKFVVACLLPTGEDGSVRKDIRTFSTMTEDLLAMLDWLSGAGCTHIARNFPPATVQF